MVGTRGVANRKILAEKVRQAQTLMVRHHPQDHWPAKRPMTAGFPSEWVTGHLPCPGPAQPAMAAKRERAASPRSSRRGWAGLWQAEPSRALRWSGSAAAAEPAETRTLGCVG